MRNSGLDRLAPLSGVAFVVLVVAGNLLQGSSPDFADEPQKIVDFYVDDPTTILLGMNVALVSLVFLVWFLASLRRTLLVAEGGDGRFSAVAWGGGLIVATLLAAGFALNALGGIRADEDGTIAEEVAIVLYDGSSIIMGFAAPMGMAVLLAATAVVTFRTAALPAWLGWVSAILAVVGLVGPVSWILLLLFPLWVLVASIVLYGRQPDVVAVPA